MSSYTPTDVDVQQVLLQAPDSVTEEEIRSILSEERGNIVDTLGRLWSVAKPKPHVKDSIQAKWDEVRDICDSYDGEMEKYLKTMRSDGST